MNHELRTMNNRSIWLTIGFSALCLLLKVATATAQVPHLIRYQGTAVDSKGVPLEGPYTLTFRLYDAQTAGTKLWEEVQPNVPISKGQFSVLLGQVTPLTAMAWDKPCWLSVQVNAESELSPRLQVTSVPLAIRAELAETAQMATVAQSAQNMKTSSLQDDANRLVPSGAIILWAAATCPTGYTRLSSLDGKFLVSGATFNTAAGGSNAHSHTTPSHSHTFSGSTSQDVSGDYRGWNAGAGTSSYNGDASRGWHTHSFSGTTSTDGGGTTSSADSRPEFATVLLCQKN